MKHSNIDSDAAFFRSLNPRQRAWFLQRESDLTARLQASLRDLAKGMSEVSAINGETLALVLDARS